MKNHISKLLFIVTAILICSSFLNAQRRSSASWSIPAGTPINVSVLVSVATMDRLMTTHEVVRAPMK